MPPRLPIALTAQPRAIRVAQRAFSASFQRGESSSAPRASPEASSSRTPSLASRSPAGPPIPTPAKGTRAEKGDLAVQPLGRPLGVPKPPTSIPKTWTDKKNELLDEDRHKATRRALWVTPFTLGAVQGGSEKEIAADMLGSRRLRKVTLGIIVELAQRVEESYGSGRPS